MSSQVEKFHRFAQANLVGFATAGVVLSFFGTLHLIGLIAVLLVAFGASEQKALIESVTTFVNQRRKKGIGGFIEAVKKRFLALKWWQMIVVPFVALLVIAIALALFGVITGNFVFLITLAAAVLLAYTKFSGGERKLGLLYAVTAIATLWYGSQVGVLVIGLIALTTLLTQPKATGDADATTTEFPVVRPQPEQGPRHGNA
jgi:hypothetical protein